jgi:hypothetical protein
MQIPQMQSGVFMGGVIAGRVVVVKTQVLPPGRNRRISRRTAGGIGIGKI